MLILPFEKRTVFDSMGRGDLGCITEEMALLIGCNHGTIRLLNGVEGRSGGYGLAHIENRRSRRILGLGYKSALAYVQFVAANFTEIGIQEDGRLVLLCEANSLFHWLICQWDADCEIWSVTTIIPKPNRRGIKTAWKKEFVQSGECGPHP